MGTTWLASLGWNPLGSGSAMKGIANIVLEPEIQALVQTARIELGVDGKARLTQLVEGGLDWKRLVDGAEWHETAALLLQHLESSGQVETIPESALSRLSAIKLEQRVRFFFFLQPELLRVLEGLESAGVEIIPLKGAFLMNAVYGDVSLRPVGDLDLLAREEDLSRAMQALAGLGYRSKGGDDSLPSGTIDDHHHCPRVLSPDGSVELELHRHVVRKGTPLFFPIERFWERRGAGEIGGRPVSALAGRDLVTHLCCAFFLDRRRRARSYGALRQLMDLSESVRRFEAEIDWHGMLRDYAGGALQAPLYATLRAARELLEAPVPSEFLHSFRPADFDDEIFGHFVRLKVLNPGMWFFHELVDPQDNHWWNMSKAAAHRLLPSTAYLRNKYGPATNPAGGRLLWRHYLDACRAALTACRRPRSMIQELRADFWMNQIQL
jgi:hypothetical protein